MSNFVHKTPITSPGALIEKLAETSEEVRRLKNELDFGDTYTKSLARLKIDKIVECILQARQTSQQDL